ncbi:MAG: hypothetical protein JW717_09500 [Marinilabiliaceae bacterium]|nr:hypothetical protein [Marinilabiliaceae bacterium]
MEFNDIIGILIMVAAIVISIVKRKLDSSKNTEPNKKKVPDILQDFFPEMKSMMEEEEEEEMPVAPVFKAESLSAEKIIKTSPSVSYENIEKLSVNSLIPDKKDPVYDNFFQPVEEVNEDIDDFDIRKAVIYSEILKRPDY